MEYWVKIGVLVAICLIPLFIIPVFGQIIDSPRKQISDGVKPENIVCRTDLTLMLRFSGSAACVKPSSAIKLESIGWGKILNIANLESQKNQNFRTNILLIVADDVGYSDLGIYGSEISTPTLNELASEGTIFTNFHVSTLCSPTRSMLLTGVDNHLAGMGNMGPYFSPNQVGKPGYEGFLNERVITVSSILYDAGYHTYLSGKWHLGSEKNHLPSNKGFEETFVLPFGAANHFGDKTEIGLNYNPKHIRNGEKTNLPDNFYSSDFYTETLIEFIDKNKNDGKPMFLYLPFTAVHTPLQVPKDFIQNYENKYKIGWDEIRKDRFLRQKELGIIDNQLELPPRPEGISAWNDLTTEQQVYEAKKMAVYAGMVENIDYNIGRLLDHLKKINEYDNTLIIFISDNGAESIEVGSGPLFPTIDEEKWYEWFEKNIDNSLDNLGNENSIIGYGPGWAFVSNSPLSGFKMQLNEGGIRVPAIIKIPNGTEIAKTDSFVSVLDITPTILDYAQIEHLESKYFNGKFYPLMGKSFRPILEGNVEKLYGNNEPIGMELLGNSALFLGDWKILKQKHPFGDGKWKLFNIVKDPSELIDVSEQEPEILQKMIILYEEYEKNVGVIPPDELNNLPPCCLS